MTSVTTFLSEDSVGRAEHATAVWTASSVPIPLDVVRAADETLLGVYADLTLSVGAADDVESRLALRVQREILSREILRRMRGRRR